MALVGNGVDLANGYKTSYEDFHSWLNSEKKTLELYNQIEERSKWMSVEEELGNISLSKDYTAEDLINDKEQLQDDLREYLKEINDEIPTLSDELRKQNVVRFINNMDSNLQDMDKDKFQNILNNHRFNSIDKDVTKIKLNFVTLNYTYLLERYLHFNINMINTEPIGYSTLMSGYEISGVSRVIHAHGDLNESFIFGLDNSSQINNKIDEMNGKYLIKEELNKMVRSSKSQEAIEAIVTEGDVLIISGASLGPTDNSWRKQIIATLAMNKKSVLIVNVYVNGEVPRHSPMKMSKIINDEKNKFNKCFVSSADLKEFVGKENITIEEIQNRILIALFSEEESNIGNLKFDTV
ncbi:AbiH family protein [Periweissella ghanensis]|uniref:AbiH family protein n=1 Tax=Periweissella ghanensis TaxID=467997 RepID=UPI002030FCB9